MTTIRRHVWVSGRVQGVWFRQSTAQAAGRHGVHGWVRNLRDGRVEAVLEGEPAAVTAIVDWCRAGPSGASVTSIEVAEEKPSGLLGFEVRPTP